MRWKEIRDQPWFHQAAGKVMAGYLRTIRLTTPFALDPPDLYDHLRGGRPFIITQWHGQHYMAPLLRRPEFRVKALVSQHRDAAINAIAAESLGVNTIRGSGATDGRFDRKGGVRAFMAMRAALEQGWNVMMTADVPKVARVVGRGIVLLGSRSGRPIFPVAMATSRRLHLDTWDKSAFNLPFGRGAIVLGEPICVPADADEAALEIYRRCIEDALNAVTARAYAIVDTPAEDKRFG